ncbi:M20 metallopeptidase family protein [Desmospora profundinema]|uniref:Amidohydrolase n=1 Tax=Desmospora profundinema TaxID=1571184 RepID=A0ABU1IK59_9BACL|nr:M20 family metallopeptidase [Desmospora profundinema]MDR6225169.1 amidohydrolase [Desmospora profundinema]
MLKGTGETAQYAMGIMPQLVAWRRQIHANPELSFREFETARLVADVLARIPGMAVETEVGVTGVVGRLGSGDGPTIALRADMDALPIQEVTDRSYRSQIPGVMHACGHDAHIAILLGAARILGERFQERKGSGNVHFIFQPAEEYTGTDGKTGAVHMIEAGVLEGVDLALALHMAPEWPVGTLQIHDGYSMASVDTFEGTLYGTGGHGAYPHLGTDPTFLLLPVLQALHGIISRRVSPLEPAVVSVGQIHAGTASNVIPSEVFLQGTIRSYRPDVREQLIREVEQAFGLARQMGGDFTFEVDRGEPVLYNDPNVNRRILEAVRSIYPEFHVVKGPFGMAGEDFSYMTEKVAGAMFFLGCGLPDGVSRELHTPVFDIDERCLPVGAAIMAETAWRYLRESF